MELLILPHILNKTFLNLYEDLSNKANQEFPYTSPLHIKSHLLNHIPIYLNSLCTDDQANKNLLFYDDIHVKVLSQKECLVKIQNHTLL